MSKTSNSFNINNNKFFLFYFVCSVHNLIPYLHCSFLGKTFVTFCFGLLVFCSFFCNLPYFKTFSRYMNLTRCQTSTVIYACCVTSVLSKCCYYRDCRGEQYIFQRTKLSVKLCIKNSKRSKKEAVAKKEAGEQRNSCFFYYLGYMY